MIHQKSLCDELILLKREVLAKRPLIHALTNAISMNDCANVILALGGKPIMAEHPNEVLEITAHAKALVINLGNISDARMASMRLCASAAYSQKRPWLIDLVGVGCSTLRKQLAEELINAYHPQVIKGNMSEIKAMCHVSSHAEGIDVGDADENTEENILTHAKIMSELSNKTGAVIVATGRIDLIVYRKQYFTISNGCEMLSRLTGTGCMLGMMIATYLTTGKVLEASILGVSMMTIAGECALPARGNGTFRANLLDELYCFQEETLRAKLQLESNRMG